VTQDTKIRGKARRQRRPYKIENPASQDLLDIYIAEAHDVPSRSAVEQKELARVMRDTRKSARARADARDKLISSNIRFAFSIAKQYQHRGLDLEDLIAEANTGLVRAADKYDPDVGVNFISYAVWWIRQAIHAALARQSRSVRLPANRASDLTRIARARAALESELGRSPTTEEIAYVAQLSPAMVKDLEAIMQPERSLDDPLGDGRGAGGDGRTLASILSVDEAEEEGLPGGVEEESRRELLLRALESLPPRDRRVLMLYYGLEGSEPKTLNDIAGMLGVTRERVRQLRDRALAAIRRGNAADELKREWAA
jgi:RNA polymerase primary sigma factor